jgi:hypothetical protein
VRSVLVHHGQHAPRRQRHKLGVHLACTTDRSPQTPCMLPNTLAWYTCCATRHAVCNL